MSWAIADAVDYKGSPADRSKTGGWVRAAQTLGIELCERLSTIGILVNLVTYLVRTMHLPSATSANIVSNFAGTSYLLCLLGGFLADSFLGRYKTIAISATIQSLGTGMLALVTKLPQLRPPPCNETATHTCEQASGFQIGFLYLALYLAGLGMGGIKSSVSGFGTDQFDEKDEREKSQMAYFFGRFFFFINFGTLMAVTVLVYIQDEVSRSWGYGICSIAMFMAVLIFLAGTKKYRYKKRSGIPIVHIFRVIVAAIKKRKMDLPYNISMLHEDTPEASRIHHTEQFHFLDKAAIIAEGDIDEAGSSPNPWKLCSVTRVEEVKMVVRILPIWATTIMFWTIHAQMITFSVEQATTMERSIGNFQIPAASINVVFIATIMLTLAVYDRLILPHWKKWKGKPGFTNIQRMAIGLVLSIVGMVAAALAERKRLSVARAVRLTTATLPISVFLLIPQFFLVGIGEAFTYTGQLDFFITQSPKGMKAMSTGLFLSTIALGYFTSSFLVVVVKKVTRSNGGQGWLADNINYGRLDLFYGILATLSAVNLVIYIICAVWYKPKKPEAGVQMQTCVNGSSAEEKC